MEKVGKGAKAGGDTCNYCGKPGTATENMPKVFYPDLDNDMIKHSDKLAKQPPQR